MADQMYLVAKQNHMLQRLKGHVDIAVCDASLLNAEVYADYCATGEPYKLAQIAAKTARQLYNTFENIGFLLPRSKPYVQSGRTQTEQEARGIDDDFSDLQFINEELEFSCLITPSNYQFAAEIIAQAAIDYLHTGTFTSNTLNLAAYRSGNNDAVAGSNPMPF